MKTLPFFALSTVVALLAISVLKAPDANAAPPATPRIESNKLTVKNFYVEPRSDCTYDFPALAASNTASANGIQCAESWNCTATGAAITDTCLASTNLGVDGGSALAQVATLSCRAVANAHIFKLCWQGNDAGTYDLGDAGFYGRSIH